MNQINCVNCNENILEMILSDYRATVYFKEFNHDNNNFEKMSVLFNEFSGWECGHCDEEILDDETFAKLVKLMPSLEDLDNVDFKKLNSNNTLALSNICPHCNNDIRESGVSVIVDVHIKFNKEAQKFEIDSIENTQGHSYTCDECYETLYYSDSNCDIVDVPVF